MKSNPFYIVKGPVITEESTIQSTTKNQYIFKVDPRANKHQIRWALEQMYPDIKITNVNTMNYLGKRRTRGRFSGIRSNWKKAIVTLRKGDTLDLI